MFPVFHLDVAKIDRGVAHVAKAIHVCFKYMFQIFYLFFQTFIVSALSGCFICFTRMLQLFYLDIAYICNGFQEFSYAFASVSDTSCKCFSYFIQMLQVFHLNVLKVDRDVAHIAK
jgi:hypothetical protein